MIIPAGMFSSRTAWTPAQLSPRVWLDATLSPITKDGSNQVSQWSDISGNGRHGLQATTARMPIHDAANGWMAFSATARYFAAGPAGIGAGYLPPGNSAWTAATVFRFPTLPTSNPTGISIYRQGNWSNNLFTDFGVGRFNGPYNRFYFSHYGSDANGTMTPLTNTDYIMICTYDPAVGRRIYINGNTTADMSNAYVSQNLPSTPTYYAVGPDVASGDTRGESRQRTLIAIAGALSTNDRQKIEGYLAWRWGIQASLAPGHPYISSPPYL